MAWVGSLLNVSSSLEGLRYMPSEFEDEGDGHNRPAHAQRSRNE